MCSYDANPALPPSGSATLILGRLSDPVLRMPLTGDGQMTPVSNTSVKRLTVRIWDGSSNRYRRSLAIRSESLSSKGSASGKALEGSHLLVAAGRMFYRPDSSCDHLPSCRSRSAIMLGDRHKSPSPVQLDILFQVGFCADFTIYLYYPCPEPVRCFG
jgi:hypothetical protein